jgi:hypothetical protein
MKLTKQTLRKMIKEEMLNEKKKDHKYYQKLLLQVQHGLYELSGLGEDYSIFQDAKHAHKWLKAAWKAISKVS